MKIEIISTKVNCPYCGHENVIVYLVDAYEIHDVKWCDSESGGCDKRFVIQNPRQITFTSEVFKVSEKSE